MKDEQREKRRLAQRKRRNTPHGRATYREYMRKLMARLRAEHAVTDAPATKFPPIVNDRDPLLDMTPARSPWKPVGRPAAEDIYEDALRASRASQSSKPKIIKPDRPL